MIVINTHLGHLRFPTCLRKQAKQRRRSLGISPRQHVAKAGRASHPARLCCSRISSFQVLTAAAAQADINPGPEPSRLQTFLRWLQANGTEGVDGNAKVSIYTDEEGDRGMLFTADVAEDEVLLRIPLRLAVVSHADDKEINAAMGRDAAYDERLAWKLLQHVQRGPDSPLHPYIQVLPEHVNSPYDAWQPSRCQDLQLWGQAEDLQHVLHHAAGSNFPGGFSQEHIRWALAIVHSRAFYTPVESGGMGICMLVPMADIFNHGGDVADFRLSGSSTTTENVKWRLVRPDDGEGWSFTISAARAAEAGEEALFVYDDEKPSWHFFLHYGFVPPRNPHEEAVLFGSTEEAVAWYLHRFPIAKVGAGEDDGDSSHMGPSKEGQSETELTALALAAAAREEVPLHDSLANHVPSVIEQQSLKLTAMGELDFRLMAAFSSLVSQAPPRDGSNALAGIKIDAELVVGLRVVEMLYSPNVTSLLTDLVLLSRLDSVYAEERQYFLALLEHYTQVKRQYDEKCANLVTLSWCIAGTDTFLDSEIAALTASNKLDDSGVLALRLRASMKQVLWEGVQLLVRNRL